MGGGVLCCGNISTFSEGHCLRYARSNGLYSHLVMCVGVEGFV